MSYEKELRTKIEETKARLKQETNNLSDLKAELACHLSPFLVGDKVTSDGRSFFFIEGISLFCGYPKYTGRKIKNDGDLYSRTFDYCDYDSGKLRKAQK